MIHATLAMNLSLLAYIGPGGGIALLGPLLGVVLAVLGALFMVVLWPIRMMLRKGRSGANGPDLGTSAASRTDVSESLS